MRKEYSRTRAGTYHARVSGLLALLDNTLLVLRDVVAVVGDEGGGLGVVLGDVGHGAGLGAGADVAHTTAAGGLGLGRGKGRVCGGKLRGTHTLGVDGGLAAAHGGEGLGRADRAGIGVEGGPADVARTSATGGLERARGGSGSRAEVRGLREGRTKASRPRETERRSEDAGDAGDAGDADLAEPGMTWVRGREREKEEGEGRAGRARRRIN